MHSAFLSVIVTTDEKPMPRTKKRNFLEDSDESEDEDVTASTSKAMKAPDTKRVIQTATQTL